MQLASIPAKFNIPFANSAGGSFIRPVPQASQIGVQGGAASLTDGFPPLNFTPIASGGVPPFGEDMNGLLNQSTAWDRWFSAGGPILYDGTFASGSGGYPKYAVVMSTIVPGNYYMSTVDDNQTNPDAGGAGWVPAPGLQGTGAWQWRPVAATLFGWLIMNGTFIGNALSGADQLAGPTAQFAYIYLWTNFSNTQCPVAGGRGANALADFNASKSIKTLNMQAIGISGVDGMGGTPTGLLTGVPIVSGGVTTPGSVVGSNLQGLIIANLPVITPTGIVTNGTITTVSNVTLATFASVTGGNAIGGGGAFGNNSTNSFTSTQGASTFTGNAFGSNTQHNNFSQKMLGYWYMKL